MEAKLQAALNRIQELESENEKLREQIIELHAEIEYRESDETDMCNIIQEMKMEINELKLRVENIEQNNYDDVVYPEADSEEDAEWFDLKVDSDYEICNWFPYNIRKKSNGRIVGEWINKQNGYINVALNSKCYQKHILIAKHFIPNPNHLPIVDHINHNREDYHIFNLRWVSARDNSRNKYGYGGSKYEYVDTLPNDCQQITLFKGWEFENYFISADNKIWFYNGNQYRELKIYKSRSYLYVSMMDINNKHHSIGLNALIQEFN